MADIRDYEANLLLAIDALNFPVGDWLEESKVRHLQKQITMARNHLQVIADQAEITVPAGDVVLAPRNLTANMRTAFWEANEAFEDGEGVAPDLHWQLMMQAYQGESNDGN